MIVFESVHSFCLLFDLFLVADEKWAFILIAFFIVTRKLSFFTRCCSVDRFEMPSFWRSWIQKKKIRSSKHQISFDTARTGSCSWNGCSKNSDFCKFRNKFIFKLSFVIWLFDTSSSKTVVYIACLVLWYEIHNDFIIIYHKMIDRYNDRYNAQNELRV